MAIILLRDDSNYNAWLKALNSAAPEIPVYTPETVKDKSEITFALSWKAPRGAYAEYPNLKAISSMGAGADHLLEDDSITEEIPLARIVDNKLAEDMGVFVLTACLNAIRFFDKFFNQQADKNWERYKYPQPQDVTVGILGFGTLGQHVGKLLQKNDFKVIGYSHSRKEVPGIKSYTSDEMDEFLAQSQILICLLPLNENTKDILNADLFAKLPEDAYLINVGRGGHLKEEDFIPAIENGNLKGATLDVFKTEPLPKEHPFWNHPDVFVTPHTASISSPRALASQVAENYKRMKLGEELKNSVSRKRGY